MMNDEEILKKVLSGRLIGEERKDISEQEVIARHLKSQWDDTTDESVLSVEAKDRVLGHITKTIRGHKSFMERWRRYGIAASLALLLSVGYWLGGINEPDVQTVYVVNAGRQSMESFDLPDGSHVSLNAGSQLTYPEHFSGKNREIYLSGQAFFKVHHDTDHPFIVKTKNMDVKALGTSFEVFSIDSVSYTEMILSDGAVEVNTKKSDGEGDIYLVLPNEKLTYELNGKAEIEKVDASQYSAWYREGKPRFKNEKLAMILPRLENWFGTHLECPDELADKYSFTFSVHNESLELLLNIISNSSPVSYHRKGDGFILYEKRKKR